MQFAHPTMLGRNTWSKTSNSIVPLRYDSDQTVGYGH